MASLLEHADQFRCPCDAHGTLVESGASVRCVACSRTFPVADGVPNFTSKEVFWGEFSAKKSEQLLKSAEKSGWLAAAKEHLRDRPELVDYIANLGRANHFSLLPPSRLGRLLDVGCGWGAIASGASLRFEEVYAIEAVPTRARYAAIRFRQEGRANIRVAQASIFELPFADGTFDVINLNGILEWIGDWNRSLRPTDAQRDVLKRLHRLLKPGGILVVGIENRFGYNFALGRRDHNGLRYTSFLPRPLANAVQKAIQRQPYTVYTYSLPALKRLLASAGFRNTQAFAPIPGYNLPNYVISLEDNRALAHYLSNFFDQSSAKRRIATRAALALNRLGLLRYVVPDFCCFAAKAG